MKQTDFLNELSELALGSRLKRMSERMLANAAQVYQEFDMNINPKWFTLIALLDAKTQVTIVEASDLLGLSQPALSQFAKELQAEGLLLITKGEKDARQRLLSLSKEGRVRLAQMKPIWSAVHKAAKDLCIAHNNDFYRSLVLLEKSFTEQNLLARTREYVRQSAMNTDISFLDYQSQYAPYFESINKEWIDDMFVLEDIDKQVLEDPNTHIIKKGGKIFFAKHPELGIVGACALLNKGNGAYELTKMGVSKTARGLKVGELLLQHVINKAQEMPVNLLFLLTNAKCEAAIHLYEKNGFVHCKDIMQQYGQSYERCNVAMKFIAQ